MCLAAVSGTWDGNRRGIGHQHRDTSTLRVSEGVIGAGSNVLGGRMGQVQPSLSTSRHSRFSPYGVTCRRSAGRHSVGEDGPDHGVRFGAGLSSSSADVALRAGGKRRMAPQPLNPADSVTVTVTPRLHAVTVVEVAGEVDLATRDDMAEPLFAQLDNAVGADNLIRAGQAAW